MVDEDRAQLGELRHILERHEQQARSSSVSASSFTSRRRRTRAGPQVVGVGGTREPGELSSGVGCDGRPVRFAGWDHDGKPLGAPVQSPYIPVAAPEEQQGGTYQAVEFMLPQGALSATPPERDPATTCKSGKRSSIVRKFISP